MGKIITVLTVLIIGTLAQAQLPHCTPDNRFTQDDYFGNSEIVSLTDVSYGQALDEQNNLVDLLYDVHMPDTSIDL